MASLAPAMAPSSSPRLFVSPSKSSAFVMHSWCKSESPATSVARSLEVIARSPSAADFFSLAAAWPSLASAISLLANWISSFRPCSIISKACRSFVSLLRISWSWPSASSKRSVSVWTMSPLWLSYTAPAGAPASPSSDEVCTRAAMRSPSAVLSIDARTNEPMDCAKLVAPLSWSMEAPPFFNSRSKMPTARWRVSTTSMSSRSEASKTVCSLVRMSVAEFKSASSTWMSPASASIFAVSEPMVASPWAMTASSSPASDLPVLTSCWRVFERSSHHSENSP
mmetsp:Transcript_8559/g.23872  ORF Transcript_8559/g.23872 Transcript_8559/m.23872 type:complete len:282 (+) Transcript_8559:1145-1990(+)